jgi:TolB protein
MESGRRSVRASLVGGAVVAGLLGGACAPAPAPTSAPSATLGVLFPSPSGATASTAPSAAPSTALRRTPRPAATPKVSAGPALGTDAPVIVLGTDATLSLVEPSGRRTTFTTSEDGTYTFPAWSPDGTRIAAIRYASDNAIELYDLADLTSGAPIGPTDLFRSTSTGPFYLSWSPTGASVGYLADQSGTLSLRLAKADGSSPLDGTGPGTTVGTGNPFYFDWIDDERLFAHVGSDTSALLGEIGLDGTLTGPGYASPGSFRSGVVSHDGRYVGYVRTEASGASEVVVAARDGSSEHDVPLRGFGAVSFDPTGDTAATIGPTEPGRESLAIPVGPVRLIDPIADTDRELLDGTVVGFWWSPDGRTIAAIRVQPAGGVSTTASPAPSASPPPNEVRLLFLDVRSGDIRSQQVIDPGQLFIDQFLTYFDQYALSHHLWSPDSTAFLVPTDVDGATKIAVTHPNGDEPIYLDGQAAFFSPVTSPPAP